MGRVLGVSGRSGWGGVAGQRAFERGRGCGNRGVVRGPLGASGGGGGGFCADVVRRQNQMNERARLYPSESLNILTEAGMEAGRGAGDQDG